MIIYNVTINIEENIEEKWLLWMKARHINDVLSTGLFLQARLIKVHTDDQTTGVTYAVQYYTESKEDLEEYYQKHAPRLREEGLQMFGDKMLAFRTELEIIEEFFHVN